MNTSQWNEHSEEVYLRRLDRVLDAALKALAPYLSRDTPETLTGELVSYLHTHLKTELEIIFMGFNPDELGDNNILSKLHWKHGSPKALRELATELRLSGQR